MTTTELLKEVLKDPIFKSKYKIPQSVLDDVTFDTASDYDIIEIVKIIIQYKDQGMADSALYRQLKIYFGGE